MEPKHRAQSLDLVSLPPPVRSAGISIITTEDRVLAALWFRLRTLGHEQARAQLFTHHTRFARTLARSLFRKYPPGGMDVTDFEQLAFEGLLQSIDRFDPFVGTPFQAYARRRIVGAIRDGVAKSSDAAAAYRARRRIMTDRMASLRAQPASGSTEDMLEALSRLVVGLAIGVLADQAVAEIDAAASNDYMNTRYGGQAMRELQISVIVETEKLDEPELSIMRQHYFEGVPFAQIAQALGLSKGRVSQIHRSALAKLKDRLKDKGD